MGGGNDIFAVVAHEGPADFDDITIETRRLAIEEDGR
jgi:hypothetical protein